MAARRLSLGLRNYYYPQLSVKLTAEVEQGWFRFDDDEKTHRLDQLSDRVDAEMRRQMRSAGKAANRQWWLQGLRDGSLAILAVTALAAAAYFTRR